MKEESKMSYPGIVLDTSAAMALFLQEKEGIQLEEIINNILNSNGQIFVPSLFWFEVGNTLISAFNRKRITQEEIQGIEFDISELPVVTDPFPDLAIRIRIREIAILKNLTYYDASYVELAKRLELPLKSFDKKLNLAMS
jgi:predicted nucleic acid-binding protein